MDALQEIGKADSWVKGLWRYFLYLFGGIFVMLSIYLFKNSFNEQGTPEEIEQRKKDRSGSYIIFIIGIVFIFFGYLAGKQVERTQSSSVLSTLAGVSALGNLFR
jgi:hypothetical protein